MPFFPPPLIDVMLAEFGARHFLASLRLSTIECPDVGRRRPQDCLLRVRMSEVAHVKLLDVHLRQIDISI